MLQGSRGCDTLVIFSSPHKDGFTAHMLDTFLQQNGIDDYHFFDCYDEMPQPCVGCNLCEKVFRCSRTDLSDFGSTFLSCKRLIIATPIYNNGLPAPLKALLDRNQIFFSARFSRNEKDIAAKKEAILLMTCGSQVDKTQTMLDILLPAFTVNSTTLVGHCLWKGTDQNSPMPTDLPTFNDRK